MAGVVQNPFRWQQKDYASAEELRPERSGSGFDYVNLLTVFFLAIIGLAFIQSVESYKPDVSWRDNAFIKQCVYFAMGGCIYLAVSLVDYKVLLRKYHWVYIAGIVLLLLLETPLGVQRYNARRWLDFGVLLFQPSEAAKIGILVFTAGLLAREEIGSLKDSLSVLFRLGLAVSIPFLLIFKQPDLGSAMVIPPMVFALLYASRISRAFFALVFGVAITLGSLLTVDLVQYHRYMTANGLSFTNDRGKFEEHGLLPLKDYQRNRILTFAVPEIIDPRGTGERWNSQQSMIAVGTGGILGKGIGEGDQARLGYLPQSVAHNDFIFSVIAEEAGFLGGLTVIGLFTVLVLNTLKVAALARDRFGTLLALGIATILVVHIFVNIGMTQGLMPVKGIPLPFISYGGSFVLSCCALLGLVQSIHRHRRDFS